MSWEGRGWTECVSSETSIKEQPMPPSAVQGCCSGSPEGGRTRTGCAGSSLQWQLRSQAREAAHARAVLEVPCSGSSARRPEETLCGQLGCPPWSSRVHRPGQRRTRQPVVMPAPSWFSSSCLPALTSHPLQALSHPPGFFPASLPS